jgi:hypothetical protein
MFACNWLHLTDLHYGARGQPPLWPNVRQAFFDDLAKLHARCGPWHAVFFTGDLVQSGEDFNAMQSEVLVPLWSHLNTLGSQPVLLAVPGNHDLVRPDVEKRKPSPAERFLIDPAKFSEVAEELWTDPSSEYRELIVKAFANYVSWWQGTPFRVREEIRSGLLPGDFAATLHIDTGHTIGIVGLNTAFLQLTRADYHAKLVWNVRQFNAACTGDPHGDGPGWVRQHVVCILLTHHGSEWLDTKSRDEVYPEINPAGRFAVHLFGHMHENVIRNTSTGGGKVVRQWQGSSLFSQELWGNPPTYARHHGYAVGKIEGDSSRAFIRHWPRAGKWSGPNGWRFIPDHESTILDEAKHDDGTIPDSVECQPAADVARALDITLVPNRPDLPGWQFVDLSFLERQREPLSKANAIRFFDGANPDWHVILSPEIPRLSVVARMMQQFQNWTHVTKPHVFLLIGPIGEGKSTALMQIVEGVLQQNSSWKVLWHADVSTGLSSENVLGIPQVGFPWLLVSDAADLIAEDIYEACSQLEVQKRGDIHFLIVSRETDWKASRAHRRDWLRYAAFHPTTLSGLSEDDARDIVAAWMSFGPEATGRLAGKNKEEAALELFRAATQEAAHRWHEGALLGAMLIVRYGDGLKEHIKSLLSSLEARKILGGNDLLLALSCIAAMHAENYDFLSRPVLAEMLNCPLEKIDPLVLVPLGREAATSSHGQFILTRHRAIARAVLSLLTDVFEYSVDEIYLKLVTSAETLRSRGEYVPELRQWHYELSSRLLETGRRDLAIRIAQVLVDKNPYPALRVHLASLYRKVGISAKGARLFRQELVTPMRRPELMEWGKCEDSKGAKAFGTILMALSLCDHATGGPPNSENAARAFLSLKESLEALYENYREVSFKDGHDAVIRLALMLALSGERKAQILKGVKGDITEVENREEMTNALSCFKGVVSTAYEFCDIDEMGFIKRLVPKTLRLSGTSLTIRFNGLHRVLANTGTSKGWPL